MATAILTNTPTIIDSAESTSNWNGDSFSLEPDIKVAGSNSVACTQTNSGPNDLWVQGSWDLTAGEHLRLWINSSYVSAYGDTKANDGMQIWIADGNVTAYWTVGGSDTYSGGWRQFVVYTGNTPTSGTVPTGNTTQIGFRINTTSKPRNVPANMWVDQWTYGDGYTVTGGTNGDEINWSHIAAADKANAYGIVSIAEDTDNMFLLAGKVTIGNGSTTTYFKDDNQMANFKDTPVSSSLYQIVFQGSGTNVSINGGLYDAAGSQTFDFLANDVDLASFSMIGKAIVSGGNTVFKSGETVLKCVFNNRGLLTIPNDVVSSNFTYCDKITLTGSLTGYTVDSSVGTSSIEVDDLAKLNAGSITSDGTNHAVKLTSLGSGTMTWYPSTTGYDTGLTGSPVTPTNTGNEDIYVAVSSGTLTINVDDNATIPSIKSDGATVNVVSGQVTATFVLNPSITNYEYALYTVSSKGSIDGGTQVDHVESYNSDTINYTYTYSAGEILAVQLLFGDGSVNDFIESVTYYDLPSTDTTFNINLVKDENN